MKTLNPVVIDSSALLSLQGSDDSNHAHAVTISNTLDQHARPIILPGDVLSETLNVVGKKLGRKQQLELGRELQNAPGITIVEATPEIRAQALLTLQNQPASVSYTDCIVMMFANHYQTRDIFGFDECFRKNGYHLPSETKAV